MMAAAIQLKFFLELYSQLEQRSWLEMASRYFDHTGKRVNVEYLKERLVSLGLCDSSMYTGVIGQEGDEDGYLELGLMI